MGALVPHAASGEGGRARAAELYATARQQEANGEFHEARESYEASLDVHYDEEVEAAHRKLMSRIGPA